VSPIIDKNWSCRRQKSIGPSGNWTDLFFVWDSKTRLALKKVGKPTTHKCRFRRITGWSEVSGDKFYFSDSPSRILNLFQMCADQAAAEALGLPAEEFEWLPKDY
jgi:hypothetical protein